MINWRKRVKEARQKSGLTREMAARLADISEASYYDIEEDDDDLVVLYGLSDFFRLIEIVGASIEDSEEQQVAKGKSSGACGLRANPFESKFSSLSDISELEDIVGYELEETLRNPSKALNDWNIDCLEALCRELGMNHMEVLRHFYVLWKQKR